MAEQTYSVADLKKILKGDDVIIGTDRTLKELKRGAIERVFITSNCPSSVEKDVEYYSSLSGADLIKLPIPNEELGVICKKPFSISVAAIVKSESK